MSDTVGVKFDISKPKFSLLPWEALVQAVWVLMFGEAKYDTDNWKKIEDAQRRYLDSMQRHAADVFVGLAEGKKVHEILDSQSGMPTLAHVVCCALFALWFSRGDLPKTYDISWVREHFRAERERYFAAAKINADGNATAASATGEP